MQQARRPADGFAVFCYRLALALYPLRFRRRFGAEMVVAFRDRLRDARRAGAAERLRFALTMVCDVVVSLAGEYAAATLATPGRARRSASIAGGTLLAALALGAAVCSYVVADAVVFRPLPYPHADRLVAVNRAPRDSGGSYVPLAAVRRVFQASAAFERVGGYDVRATKIPYGGELVSLVRVHGDLFGALGARARYGRLLAAADAPRHALLLSASCWRTHFAADPRAIGRTVRLGAFSGTVVGVLDDGFAMLDGEPDVYAASELPTHPDSASEQLSVYQAVALLRAGEPAATAERALAAHGHAAHGPADGLVLRPLALDGVARFAPALRVAVAVSAALAALALLLLGSFVASVPLGARLAVLGASAAGGIGLATAALPALASAERDGVPHLRAFALGADAPAVGAALLALAGLVALAARSRLVRRAPGALVAAGLLVACALSAVSVTSIGAWHDARNRAAGLAADDRLRTTVILDERRYPSQRSWGRIETALAARLHADPVLAQAALGTDGPLGPFQLRFDVKSARAGHAAVEAAYEAVAPGFLDLVGMRIVRGRDVRAGDDARHPRVGLVDEVFARAYFGRLDVLGRRVQFDRTDPGSRVTIVGILAPVRMVDVDAPPPPVLIVPLAQHPWPFFTIAARTTMDERQFARHADALLAGIDPHLASVQTRTDSALVAGATARYRDAAALATGGAAVAWLVMLSGLTRARRLRRRFLILTSVRRLT